MPLELNSLLHNRYRILSELGHGGMGAVYFGRDENLGVDVAVKENMFVSPESERQFKREANLLASLRHPNLPRVTDHFVLIGQGQYLVMDFIGGDDLRQRLDQARGPLPEPEVVAWAAEILDALQYLHALQPPIVHRDIKPGNIKITPEGRAVLVDFGLAKVHDIKQQTTTGAKALTPGFAPPEQYGVGRTDPRTDIYALAATLYNLLTNEVPADSLERAIGNQKIVPVRQANPRVSQAVAEALERGLAIKPEDRFASAADFHAALTAGAAPRPEAPPTVRAAAAPTRRHAAEATIVAPRAAARPAWLIPGIVLAGLIVVGGGLALLWSGRTTAPRATASATLVPATDTVPAPTRAPTSAPTFVPTTAPLPTDAPTPALTAKPPATPRGGGAHGQIAFVSERAGRPQIFLMNADGSGQTQLTTVGDGACQPAWSPDGSVLVFVSPCSRKTDSYARASVYSLNPDDPAAPVNIFISLLGGAYDPAWSATGVAFTGLEQNRAHIYVADQGGGNPTDISRRLATEGQATWSPDGTRVAFRNTSNAGRPLIFWMYSDGTTEGTSPNQVTQVDADHPAWSPRGDVVAYVADSQIFVVPWDSKSFGAVQLTERGPNDHPAWSPDGNWLAFESWRVAANHDIYVMNSSGGGQTRLTEDVAAEYQPAWRP